MYQRVSTINQNTARQEAMVEKYGIDKVFCDKMSGATVDRPALKEMLSFVRENDEVYVSELARLARSTKDLLNIVEVFNQKGVKFISIKENIDTSTPTGMFFLQIMGSIAELERNTINERARQGREIAKAQGKYKGRVPMKLDESKFKEVCSRWRAGEITAVKAMEIMNLKPNTFYRKVKERNL